MKLSKYKPYLFFFALLFVTGSAFSQNIKSTKELFQHVLLFKWADSLNQDTKTEVLNLFIELPDKIEGFESIDIIDISKSSDGFDNVLILQFTSEEVVKTYKEHPDHLRITEIAPPLLSKIIFFDYWEQH